MKKKLALVFVVVAILCFAPAGLQAGEYEITFTADDIFQRATFPTRTPYLVNNSLVFELLK